MSVTIPLLDSLLSGQNEAESHYRSIPLSSRVRELTLLLTQLSSAVNTGNVSNNDEGRAMLAATLLRRDLSRLSIEEGGMATAREIAEPLMLLFERNHNRSQRMLGRCVAELCGEEGMMGHVLKRLECGVS